MSSFSGVHVVALLLYSVFNAGLIIRLYFALRSAEVSFGVRLGICLIAAAAALTFPVSRLAERNGTLQVVLAFIGTFWLAFVLNVLVAWGALDLFRLINRRARWLKVEPERLPVWRRRCCAGIAGTALLLTAGGWINAGYPVIRRETLHLPPGFGPLRIVMLGDLHLGRLASTKFLTRLVDQIEPLAPDIVVFVGDILEYDYDPEEADAAAAVLQRLNPRLGIWGVMGNHEYIADRGALSKRLLARIGIRMLIDQWESLGERPEEKILLVGRDDYSRRGVRKSLDKILEDAPQAGHLKILLDHQPFHLEMAEQAGFFLQLSGHTHNGQIFPLNFAVSVLFENAHGHSMRGQTHYWVTSGAGSWGARVRTTGRPEIVSIDLVPSPQQSA
jgi:predicted MPP superfamily phosphohydrolase